MNSTKGVGTQSKRQANIFGKQAVDAFGKVHRYVSGTVFLEKNRLLVAA